MYGERTIHVTNNKYVFTFYYNTNTYKKSNVFNGYYEK